MGIWDGVHAGLDVATLVRATQAQQTLAAMHERTQAETANDSDRRELLEAMKNYIFNVSCVIQRAEEQLSEYPLEVYIVSSSLDFKLSESGLSAQAFPELQDKEYFFKAQKKITEVQQKARQLLTPEQFDQAQTACTQIAHMSILEGTIAAKSAQESLNATDEKWRKLDARQGRKGLFKLGGIIGLVLSVVVACPLSFLGCYKLHAAAAVTKASGFIILSICGIIPVGSLALLFFGVGSGREYFELQAKRLEWKRQLLSKEDYECAVKLFGDLSSDKYQDLLEERLKCLNPLLGADLVAYLASE